jgi:hypothetical protein
MSYAYPIATSHFSKIRRHWSSNVSTGGYRQGQRIGFAKVEVEEMIGELTTRTSAVIDEVTLLLPHDFPMDVAEAIFNGMLRLNKKLATPA